MMADDAALKAKLLEAALAHVPLDGFSDQALSKAACDTGTDSVTLSRLFPSGAVSLVTAFSESADDAMAHALAGFDLSQMKVRERIAAAVKVRLDALRPHKDAARRAAAFLSLPPNAALGVQLLYRTVDAMWRAVGDTSTDFNFYTKRAILAGVYASTLVRWFNDSSDGEVSTDAFLDDRIENVMQFERFKAELKKRIERSPPLSELLRPFRR
jgi:ubiquinone biosynthesis protein COQ9